MSEQYIDVDRNNSTERIAEAAVKAWEKTEELTAAAAKFVKLKTAEAKLKSAYTKMGKYAYRHLRMEISETENLNRTMDQIDGLREQVIMLRREIQEDKNRRAEKKKLAKEAAVEAENAEQ